MMVTIPPHNFDTEQPSSVTWANSSLEFYESISPANNNDMSSNYRSMEEEAAKKDQFARDVADVLFTYPDDVLDNLIDECDNCFDMILQTYDKQTRHGYLVGLLVEAFYMPPTKDDARRKRSSPTRASSEGIPPPALSSDHDRLVNTIVRAMVRHGIYARRCCGAADVWLLDRDHAHNYHRRQQGLRRFGLVVLGRHNNATRTVDRDESVPKQDNDSVGNMIEQTSTIQLGTGHGTTTTPATPPLVEAPTTTTTTTKADLDGARGLFLLRQAPLPPPTSQAQAPLPLMPMSFEATTTPTTAQHYDGTSCWSGEKTTTPMTADDDQMQITTPELRDEAPLTLTPRLTAWKHSHDAIYFL